MTNPRKPDADVDQAFLDRWSPRSFKNSPITKEQVLSLFEAARWAPSCFNEQPWVFIYTNTPQDHERFCATLSERNQRWARNAPVLAFVACKKTFSQSGKANRHAAFDTGAAWMSLALQARKFGLVTHAMAGFDLEKAYAATALPRDGYDIMAAIAIGASGSADDLPDEIAAMESPNSRKPLSAVAYPSTFPVT